MALQAGVSTVKVLVLLGAGLTGTLLVNNGSLSDFITDISKVISKHFEDGNVAGKFSDDAAAHIMKMRQELRQLAAAREVTVINGSSNDGANLASLAMPVAVVGAAGYGYFCWRGWSLSDFMYVTRRHMQNAVSEVSKQFDQVSTALTGTKKHLTMRIEDVSKALEDSIQVQGLIRDQVHDIRTDVLKCGGDVQTVRQMIEGLEYRIIQVQLNQDMANQGIMFLCQYVQKLENGKNVQRLEFPKAFMQLPEASQSQVGLKELEEITEKLEKATTSSNNSTSNAKTLRPTFSIDFRRSLAMR